MDKIKILLLGDLHFRKKNVRSRTDDIEVAIRNKFKQIVEIIDSEDIDFVFTTGDTFDSASVSKYIFWLAQEMISSLKVPTYLCVGNHSLKDNVMVNYKMSDIYFLPSEAKNLHVTLGENPYIDFGNRLRVYFKHYGDNNFIIEDIDELKYNVILSHSTIVDKYEMFKAIDGHKIDTNADKIWNGHIHYPYDTEKVCNVGSLLRLSSKDRDMKRVPRVVMVTIDAENVEYESIDLKADHYEDVFHVKTVGKKQAILNDTIKDELNSAMKNVSSTKDVTLLVVKQGNYSEKAKDCLEKYVGDLLW